MVYIYHIYLLYWLPMPKLFAVYMGWKAEGSQIELHDVQFVIGDKIEDTYETLKDKWFGVKKSAHIDCYMALQYIDGYEISLYQWEKKPQDIHLYFVNAGAYDPNKFTELHENGFYVAKDSMEATKKALAELCVDTEKTHRDNLYDVDDCIQVDEVDGWHIELVPTDKTQKLVPDRYGYGRLP